MLGDHGAGQVGHAGHAAWQPHARGTDAGRFAAAAAMWMVMMVAMMLPAVMPWLLLFATTSRDRETGAAPWVSSGAFLAGYLALWAAFSILAAAVQLALQRGARLEGADGRLAPALGGAVLVAAGVFQWTPLKSACLRHCRNPLAFFLGHWQGGRVGAFRMGLRHGAWCVACCWALMAVGFALGLMNLLWMALLTAALCVEKIAPGGRHFARLFGAVLVGWGAALLGGF